MMEKTLEKCEGFLKLRQIADRNIENGWGAERVNPHFDWVIKRAGHYADKLDLPINDILNAWADDCDYSFLNYFQDAHQPEIKEEVKVFDTVEQMLESIGEEKFRCPACEGISTNPYRCNSGEPAHEGGKCNWSVNGLFGDLGRGIHVYVKEKMKGETIFLPLSWEEVKTTH